MSEDIIIPDGVITVSERQLYCWRESKYTLHVRLATGWMCADQKCGMFTEETLHTDIDKVAETIRLESP